MWGCFHVKKQKFSLCLLLSEMYSCDIYPDSCVGYCTKWHKTDIEGMNHSTGHESYLVLWHSEEYTFGFYSPQMTVYFLQLNSLKHNFTCPSIFMQFPNLHYTCMCIIYMDVRAACLHGTIRVSIRCHAHSSPLCWMQMRREISCVGISEETDTRVTMHPNKKTPVSNYSRL